MSQVFSSIKYYLFFVLLDTKKINHQIYYKSLWHFLTNIIESSKALTDFILYLYILLLTCLHPFASVSLLASFSLLPSFLCLVFLYKVFSGVAWPFPGEYFINIFLITEFSL